LHHVVAEVTNGYANDEPDGDSRIPRG
jgi:hypothetical protein